jgi:hypothetical protein
VLANFTYTPIESLPVELPMTFTARHVRSAERGELTFERKPVDAAVWGKSYSTVITFSIALGLNDIIVVE